MAQSDNYSSRMVWRSCAQAWHKGSLTNTRTAELRWCVVAEEGAKVLALSPRRAITVCRRYPPRDPSSQSQT